ncbi:short chain dehydrogenase/reductase-like protein SDR [Cucurbitaria berberidis CBS 394.84]|uniref:Short chain dehydrogenase/reductase-like protein SDR n=1 Tax=Cucurbitaria berberidis CBS 394.84 TaxID=1168544 RepID=A0A9P4LCE8_9PLEO|nr:short chain dehydrogenase/reductase-like protein SDR [Cucurbitaria berberidis CBS 394.84]KAF1849638.1 short chain dehydrogenase/reductase-like protein SDR [Cucurbitaria berberidis CBS 394.84]
MDPAQFGLSTRPLQHAPYGPISIEMLQGTNAGKVAVITGAGRGIGAAIAASLAKSGADIAILDLNIANLADTKKECLTHNVKVETFECDVTDEARLKEVFDKVEKQLGPIEILVNNAGVLDQRPFIMSTFSSFWRQIEVNFKAPLMLVHNVLPLMRSRGHGCIINIASRSGTVDVPMTLGYVTSKAALIRATHTLQKEIELDGLDPGIHMYALHPGGVLSAMGGSGAAEDVKEKYGDITDEEFYKDLFKDTPALCGQTCAYLATGRGKELRGFYIDCRQDVSKLLEIGRETLQKENRNTLTVNFIDGYANEP